MKKFFLVFAVFCVALASATAGVNEIKAQFVSNIPEDNMELDAVTSSSAVSKNWSVPLASSGAFANYGSNWISVNWLDSSNAFAYVQADWADSLMISGGVGKAPAKFRFLVSGSGSPGVNSSLQPGWSADITSPPNYFATPVDYMWGNNLRHTNDWGGFQFDYDIPFSMHSKAYGWSTGDRAGSSLVASRLTHILIPAGATISS